jgi:hypothetical protein
MARQRSVCALAPANQLFFLIFSSRRLTVQCCGRLSSASMACFVVRPSSVSARAYVLFHSTPKTGSDRGASFNREYFRVLEGCHRQNPETGSLVRDLFSSKQVREVLSVNFSVPPLFAICWTTCLFIY